MAGWAGRDGVVGSGIMLGKTSRCSRSGVRRDPCRDMCGRLAARRPEEETDDDMV